MQVAGVKKRCIASERIESRPSGGLSAVAAHSFNNTQTMARNVSAVCGLRVSLRAMNRLVERWPTRSILALVSNCVDGCDHSSSRARMTQADRRQIAATQWDDQWRGAIVTLRTHKKIIEPTRKTDEGFQ